jgi:hypothetical protein
METQSPLICFNDNRNHPEIKDLKRLLGKSYAFYDEIVKLSRTYQQEWKFYGKKIGWQLKATGKGKALFYCTPMENSFRISFALRENEKEIIVKSGIAAHLKEQLKTAKKYPEGYPLRMVIGKESDMKSLRLVFSTLKLLRF